MNKDIEQEALASEADITQDADCGAADIITPGGGADGGAKEKKNVMSVSVKSFIAVTAILAGLIIAAGIITYIVPHGRFLRGDDGSIIAGSYERVQSGGISWWRWLLAPVLVFGSEDALSIIMVSVFLLVLSGMFNVMSATGGIKTMVSRLVLRFAAKRELLVCLVCLVFMCFGSFFGMFEELVALMPLIIVLSLSLGLDTMTGMVMCMLAACFGFCAAITNPFSVGIASKLLGINLLSGVWMRVVLFAVIYAAVCVFALLHIRRIKKDPRKSLTFAMDEIKRKALPSDPADKGSDKVFLTYLIFFAALIAVILASALIPGLSGLSVPILAFAFLAGGFACGVVITKKPGATVKQMASGWLSMLPAVVMIAFASSVKYIMVHGQVMDTVINSAIGFLSGKSPYVAVMLIFALVLALQLFIGSASAKAVLIIPILAPICAQVGISYNLAVLAFVLADGFTNVLFPTNAVLLVGLSMAEVGYGKWFRFTVLLQLGMLVLSVGALCFGVAVGY